jgi:outer membrane lipoprotein-sorting protein
MRWLPVLAALCLGAPAFAQDSDAEKIYRAMENKIRAAKTLHVAFGTESEQNGKKKSPVKGSIDFTQGNKARFEMVIDPAGSAEKILAVTDGKVMYQQFGDSKAKPEPIRNAPMDQKLPGMLARGGPIYGGFDAFDLGISAPFDLDKELPIKNFKLGAKEKIGNRNAQVVEYQTNYHAGTEVMKVSVWIDTQTQLPLKRVVVQDNKRFIETYTAFTLDGQLDPKLFEIPK